MAPMAGRRLQEILAKDRGRIRSTNHTKKENHSKEIKTAKMTKAKENVLSVEIQIISSENVRNNQNIKIKRRLLEDLGVIATKMKRRRQRTKSVLWLKLLMRAVSKCFFKKHLRLERLNNIQTLVESNLQNSIQWSSRFYKRWDLASLEYSQENEGPYCTDLPTPDDIRRLLELERILLVLLWRAKTKCACCVRGFSSKSQPSISFVLLWSQSQPLKILGKSEGLPTWPLYSWGGGSRVDEMILARVSSGFAGQEVWEDIQVVPGFVGRERLLFG
ncbi:hypothetical protein Tco_0360262 [Tanacetum coccineum]